MGLQFNQKVFNIDDRLTFGQYKNRTIREVIELERDASYLIWCLETINWFQVDDETEEIIYDTKAYIDDWKLDMEGHRYDIY